VGHVGPESRCLRVEPAAQVVLRPWSRRSLGRPEGGCASSERPAVGSVREAEVDEPLEVDGTVESHISSLLAKLQSESRAGLIAAGISTRG